MAYKHFAVRPLTGAIGAEIDGVQLSPALGDEVIGEIRQAFLDHLVIFFRDQRMTPEEQIAISGCFGPLNIHPYVPAMEGHPEILEIRKEAEDRENFGGLWHTDLSFLEQPPLGSILYARDVPEVGGDTVWANLYMAYETLSGGMKEMLDGLTAIHSAAVPYGPPGSHQGDRANRETMKMAETEEALAETEHPMVRTHPETGRKCLFVAGPYLTRFKGMSADESRPLLDYLIGHSTNPKRTCRFRWEKGSVAFWDNRCTLHFALNDYQGDHRLMHRVTINGDRPV